MGLFGKPACLIFRGMSHESKRTPFQGVMCLAMRARSVMGTKLRCISIHMSAHGFALLETLKCNFQKDKDQRLYSFIEPMFPIRNDGIFLWLDRYNSGAFAMQPWAQSGGNRSSRSCRCKGESELHLPFGGVGAHEVGCFPEDLCHLVLFRSDPVLQPIRTPSQPVVNVTPPAILHHCNRSLQVT